jgi:hypothetical protein
VINRDKNLRLQYLAGLGATLQQGDRIYDDMLVYRRFPADLFTGSAELTRRLRAALGQAPP